MSKKGSAKNTKNKAKHSKLMTQKKNKSKKEAALRKMRLKEIIATSNLAKASKIKEHPKMTQQEPKI